MAKKLTVLATFEQGMDRKDGGSLKLYRTRQGEQPLAAEETAHGLVVTMPTGKKRTLKPEVVQDLVAQGLISLAD